MAATDEEPRVGQAVPESEEEEPERLNPVITRRDFLIGAGAGAAVTAAVAGGITLTRPAAPSPPAAPQAVEPPPGAPPARPADVPISTLPPTMRRVTLNINGVDYDVVTDVRWSLWEVMTYKLGMAGANLGCDRSECGACAVVIDGRAVNSCSILAARLGRGEKIITVDGLSKGTRVEDLHPIQRAFYEESGHQCGICTRGFIMSAYALLLKTPNPTEEQVREALSGNICRCGAYPEIYAAVFRAAAEMRRA
ncbi:MAG TPA: (2Fe-2S)-binding protein [Chloroflexota bacterium]|nr:(2Fe-2S)-binding protein [Chloroflexota bacterium]